MRQISRLMGHASGSVMAIVLLTCTHSRVQAQVNPGCYTIKNVQSGQFIQAMPDNTVQHVTQASGQTNQIWRLEAADGKLRVSSALGTDKVMYVDALSNDQPIRLGNDSPGNTRYRWVVELVSGTGYRVRAENKPWDQAWAGAQPTLQVWGDATAQSLPQTQNWQRFEFQSATCPGSPSGKTLTVNPSNVTMGASGGNQSVSVGGNVSWNVSSNVAWLTFGPGNGTNAGTLTLTAQANGGASRTGILTISGEGLVATVAISQDGSGGGNPPAATFDPTNIQNFVGINVSNTGQGLADGTQYRLAVRGRILAEELRVRTGWADDVFLPGYRLATLTEVERHIKHHGHLPEIPSAAVVEANGIQVGEMNSLLLRKIEELTLHLIRQQKQVDGLKRQIKRGRL